MKPPLFAYADPTDVAEACDLLAEYGDDAALLAGGQSLVPLLNLRLARPEVVIDLRRVEGLIGAEYVADQVRSGAMTRVGDLASTHPNTAVGQAIGWIGHPQIRTRTTVGGTIAHADPAAELPAVLVALGGAVELTSASGTRLVEAADWFDGSFSTSRRPDELLTAVVLPVLDGPSTWIELSRRHGDFALVGLFVGRQGHEWRVAYSGVGSTPVRAVSCETALAGGDLDAAVAALNDELDPTDDLHASAAHRRAIAVSLLRRAVSSLGTNDTSVAA